MDTKPVAIVDHIRGIDQRWSPPSPSNTLRMEDLAWDGRDLWIDAGGYRRLVVGVNDTNPYAGAGKITSLHYFSQRVGGKAWTIYETDAGVLRTFRGSGARNNNPYRTCVYRDGTPVNDRISLDTPWARTQYVAWRDRVYLFNGYNRPIVFDGETCDQVGFDAVPQPPSGVDVPDVTGIVFATGNHLKTVGVGPYSTTAGSDFDCGYRYKVSFVNERGQESPLSAASDTLTFTNLGGNTETSGSMSGAHCPWVSIPIGGPNVVARRVYRTQNMKDSSGNFVLGRGDVFYFHSEFRDNSTEAFYDKKSDAECASVVDELTLGLFPAGARIASPFAGRMFVATASASTIYYSAPNYPEVFPPDNAVDIGDASLGPPTAMFPSRDALVVFKRRGIYLVKLDSNGEPYTITLTRDVGTASHRSVVEVPNVGLCFTCEGEIYALQGTLDSDNRATAVTRLSTPIQEWGRRINRAALANACAAVYHRDREAWFCVPSLGSDTVDLILVYHYEVGAWTTRTGFPVNAIIETQDERGYLIFGSHDDTSHPGLHVYSRGWNDKDGTAIAPVMQTHHVNLASGFRVLQPKNVQLRCGGFGNNDMQMNYTINRKVVSELSTAEQAAIQKDQQLEQAPFPVYGTAVYDGDDRWSGPRAVTLRWPFQQTAGGPINDISFIFTPASRHVALAGFMVEVPSNSMDIKPLDAMSSGTTGPR